MKSRDADHRRAAGNFFWAWLIAATCMSVAGNVTHALLIAPEATRWLAAAAALVPPIVLISANHSMSMLVRTRAGGRIYWIALAATLLLALGAFVLSFDALRSVAIAVGTRPSIAWIWPAVIDVAIAHATLCLLSLTRPAHSASADQTVVSDAPQPSVATPPLIDTTEPVSEQTTSPSTRERALAAVAAPARPSGEPKTPTSQKAAEVGVRSWRPHAQALLAATKLRQSPELVAAVLAQHADGKRPGTIASHHQIPHSTVQRILAAATRVFGDDMKALTG